MRGFTYGDESTPRSPPHTARSPRRASNERIEPIYQDPRTNEEKLRGAELPEQWYKVSAEERLCGTAIWGKPGKASSGVVAPPFPRIHRFSPRSSSSATLAIGASRGNHSAMDMTLDSLQPGSIKRIRQACANCRYGTLASLTIQCPFVHLRLTGALSPNCRRKKTKCSGERPICFHCRRNRLACVYEPYAATVGDPNPAPTLAPPNNPLNNVSQRPISPWSYAPALTFSSDRASASTQYNRVALGGAQRAPPAAKRVRVTGFHFAHNNAHVFSSHVASSFSVAENQSQSPPPSGDDTHLFPPLPASPIDHSYVFTSIHLSPFPALEMGCSLW